MSVYYYPVALSQATEGSKLLLKQMTTGAIVGAAGATAAQLHKSPEERHNPVGTILKTSAITGLTVGAVNLVYNNLKCEKKALTFAAMFLAGTAIMYTLTSQGKEDKK